MHYFTTLKEYHPDSDAVELTLIANDDTHRFDVYVPDVRAVDAALSLLEDRAAYFEVEDFNEWHTGSDEPFFPVHSEEGSLQKVTLHGAEFDYEDEVLHLTIECDGIWMEDVAIPFPEYVKQALRAMVVLADTYHVETWAGLFDEEGDMRAY